jgi:putative component of toxin-antitoxin plasmid stabilization module
MILVQEYISAEGESPFRRWFDGLDAQAAAIVTVAIGRLGDGNTSSVKPIAKA